MHLRGITRSFHTISALHRLSHPHELQHSRLSTYRPNPYHADIRNNISLPSQAYISRRWSSSVLNHLIVPSYTYFYHDRPGKSLDPGLNVYIKRVIASLCPSTRRRALFNPINACAPDPHIWLLSQFDPSECHTNNALISIGIPPRDCSLDAVMNRKRLIQIRNVNRIPVPNNVKSQSRSVQPILSNCSFGLLQF